MKHSIGDLLNENKKACCICGKQIKGYGNNPWPVADEGRCCDECNYDVVLPARIDGLKKEKKVEKVEEVNTVKDETTTLARKKDIDEMFENIKWAIEFNTNRVATTSKYMLDDGTITQSQYETIMKQFEDEVIASLYACFNRISKINR